MAEKKEGFLDKLTSNVTSIFLPEKKEKKEEKKEPSLGKPSVTYELRIEKPQSGVEENYFWILTFMRNMNFQMEKISDVYTATETSSYFGAIEQKKSAQEDRASQFLGTIGNMTKSLFQIVRELRIIEERLQYYIDTRREDELGESAEIALKSMWIDIVEGGAKNPASVYGLSSQVGFIILPDLFFKIRPKLKSIKDETLEARYERERVEAAKVAQSSEKEGLNRKVIEVLQRKLFQYYDWKSKTEKELSTRYTFMLKYLKQHYATMKMYMRWVKPYLRNIKKLQMEQKESPDLITAFESSYIQLEIIGTIKEFNIETETGVIKKEFKHIKPLIKVTFTFISIPQMAYQQEYQRGAIHTGRTTIKIEAYNPKMDDYKEYVKKKENEELELLTSVTKSMESLANEIKEFLEKAEKKEKQEEKKEEKKPESLFGGIFIQSFKGFQELFGSLIPKKKKDEEKKEYSYWEIKQEEAAVDGIKGNAYLVYDIFKKAHGMLSW